MSMNRNVIFTLKALPDKTVSRILFGCGVFLAACELYKQLFLYMIINHGAYDWWFFPFQLCSIPMYLCLILPLVPAGRLKRALYTFMQDYGVIGGIAALAVPEGFSHIHWSLTLHGYAWHIVLILIGLFIMLTGSAEKSRRGFLDTFPLFIGCCLIATAVNLLAPGRGRADMFYITPYYPTTQPVFHEIALRLGILPSNLLYLAVVCLGGYVAHRLLTAAGNALAGRQNG